MHDFIRYGYIWYRVRVGVTHRFGETSDLKAIVFGPEGK